MACDETLIHHWLAGWDTYAIARAAGIPESEAYMRIHLLMPRIKRIRLMRREGRQRGDRDGKEGQAGTATVNPSS